MAARLVFLFVGLYMPVDDKAKQQERSGGGISSTVPGIPISDPKIAREEGKPPIIVYPPSRASKKWIDVGEFMVGVDGGIEWQGKTAYLSLTQNLVVVDAKTEKTLWHAGESAFWDTVTFENMAKANEPAQWAVVLKSSWLPRYSQCYDLTSGKRFALRGGPPLPPGTVLKPRKSWSGSAGVQKEEIRKLVGSAEEWSKLRKKLFGDKPQEIPEANEIEFTTEMLLVLYLGETICRDGLSPALIVEGEQNLLVRVKVHGYQIAAIGKDSKIPTEHPYGLVILPRRPKKPVVLEYNEQHYINGPELWKEAARLTLNGANAVETKKSR